MMDGFFSDWTNWLLYAYIYITFLKDKRNQNIHTKEEKYKDRDNYGIKGSHERSLINPHNSRTIVLILNIVIAMMILYVLAHYVCIFLR